jgi:predicted nucleic acid-binding protein
MIQNFDKSKLRELIQNSATKDLLYLHINPVEPKSLENALKELQKFVGKGGAEVIALKTK